MRWVFKCFQKTNTYDADVTFCGRVFHSREAATGKVRSTMVEKRVRQMISDNNDDDDRHYFRNENEYICWSNTLEHCQSNPHETDRNDVSPLDFLNLQTRICVQLSSFNIRYHVRVHSFVRRVHCKKTCLYLRLTYKTCSCTTFHIGGRVHVQVCILKDVFLRTF